VTTLEELRVRNGDMVMACGTVIATPGQPVRFCGPTPSSRIGRTGPERPPDGRFGVDLTGADLDRLTDPKSYADTRWGRVTITGRYADRTVTVTAQGAPVASSRPASSLPDGTPCPPPADGWRPGPLDPAGIDAVSELVESRPAAYGEVVMTYPDGPGMLDSGATEVLMVTTTLPVAEAERELRTRFPGNLCVRPAPRSRAEVEAVWARIDPIRGGDWERHGAFAGGPDHLAGRVRLSLVVLDEAAYRWLAEATGDSGVAVAADPWLRPVR
jgi:hypothetical protein